MSRRATTQAKRAEPWWVPEIKEDERGRRVSAYASHIREHSRARREEDLHHMRLYAGSWDIDGFGTRVSPRREVKTRTRYNLIQSGVDTAASLIAHTKPRPMVLTSEGNFSEQRQARLMTRALEGQLDDSGAYDLGPQIFTDGANLGTGALWGYLDPVKNEPACERVLPLELLIDHTEGIAGKPRTIYRQKLVERDTLRALCSEQGEKVAKVITDAAGPAQTDEREYWLNRDTLSDQVVVIEAWRLESAEGAKDGWYVMAVSSGTLFAKQYTRKRLPFSFFRWAHRQVGFWGQGLAERGRETQRRINRLIAKREDCSDLGSKAWLAVDNAAKVRVDHLTDAPVGVIRGNFASGQIPTIVTTNAVPQDILTEIAQIRGEWFQQEGISEATAGGQTEDGFDASGKAMRARDDIKSRRHMVNTKNYETFYMDVVDLFIDLNEQADEADKPAPKLNARIPRGASTVVKEVEWSQISKPEHRHRIRVFPTSLLPSTPAGKFAAVQEIIESGFMSRPFAQSLLDLPDLDAAQRIELADLDFIQWQVEQMLDGDAQQPESFQDLAFASELCRKSYLRAKADGAPDSVLQLLRDYIGDVTEKLNAAAPPPADPAMQAAPPPNGLPPGAPSPGVAA